MRARAPMLDCRDGEPAAPGVAPAAADRRLRLAVAAVLFVNAFLAFGLQPHVTKRLLPVLGGSAEVWIVCTLFFQTALLAGYFLAYLVRRLPLRVALLLHAALVAAAWWAWPFIAADGPPAGASPSLWALRQLAVQVGLLCTGLSATAPLLQMACARAAPRLDPYPLFAASNAGSLAGLLAYPLLVEPLLTLDQQAVAWSGGLVALLALLVATAGWLIGRGSRIGPVAAPAGPVPAGPAPSARQRARWLILSMVPSLLLLAVTAQITVDIAPAPFLWILPLTLYLGSFIRVFADAWRPSRWTWPALAMCALPMLLTSFYEANQWWWGVVHLAILWCAAVLCHGTLKQERPAPDRLAEFYLWLALGGAAGGLLAGIVAPAVFTVRAEYPLAVIAALWLAPSVPAGMRCLEPSPRLAAGVLTIGVATVAALAWAAKTPPGLRGIAVLVPAIGAVLTWPRPRIYALCATLALTAAAAGRLGDADGVVLKGRTFYGTYTVRDLPDVQARVLFHGTTLHGLQSLRPGWREEPLSYYGRRSPLGDVFRTRVGDRARVAVIGLGAGAMLRYARPGESWTVYEIDEAIARVAQDPALFTHWRDAAVAPRLVLGDARLRLREAADASYDLIVVDAFSSDAIPVHLLTREAMMLYRRTLRPGGAMLFDISNRYVDLGPVLAATAHALGIAAWQRIDAAADPDIGLHASRWLLAGGPDAAPADGWTRVPVAPGDSGWTDGRSNVLAALRPIQRISAWFGGADTH